MHKKRKDILSLPFWIDAEEHQRRLHDLIARDPIIQGFTTKHEAIMDIDRKHEERIQKLMDHKDERVDRITEKIKEHRVAIRKLTEQIVAIYRNRAKQLSHDWDYHKTVTMWERWVRAVDQRIIALHNVVAKRMTQEQRWDVDQGLLKIKLDYYKRQLEDNTLCENQSGSVNLGQELNVTEQVPLSTKAESNAPSPSSTTLNTSSD